MIDIVNLVFMVNCEGDGEGWESLGRVFGGCGSFFWDLRVEFKFWFIKVFLVFSFIFEVLLFLIIRVVVFWVFV